jgi:hypothetical protein
MSAEKPASRGVCSVRQRDDVCRDKYCVYGPSIVRMNSHKQETFINYLDYPTTRPQRPLGAHKS